MIFYELGIEFIPTFDSCVEEEGHSKIEIFPSNHFEDDCTSQFVVDSTEHLPCSKTHTTQNNPNDVLCKQALQSCISLN